MKIIGDIINELADSRISLTSPLLKTKVLATRIKNDCLLAWVDSELSGYTNPEDLPGYRSFHCSLTGTYLNGYTTFSNQALPASVLPASIRDMYCTMDFAQSVEALESLKSKDGGVLHVSLNAEMISVLENYLKKMNNPFLQILAAHKSLPDTSLNQILSVIRSKLLDFMLKLEEEFGTSTDIQILQRSNKKITSIMNQTIVTNGNGNLLNTGDSAKIKARISVSANDKDSLKKVLHDNGVSEADTAELMTVIDNESPNAEGHFSNQVNDWIAKMIGKALNGSWQIGVGAAGAILAEGIQHYYGLK